MWIFPNTTISNVWMGISYGPVNRSKLSLEERLPELQSPFSEFAFLHQVHGSDFIIADKGGKLGKADALIGSIVGLGLVIQTADCVPIFLYNSDRCAVIHAGWRGIAANIVTSVCVELGTIQGAVIGPCISTENYEVGEEVIQGIAETGIKLSHFVDRSYPKSHVNLREAVRLQLLHNGVEEIEVFKHCTFNDSGLASYRRNGIEAGRILSVIGRVG